MKKKAILLNLFCLSALILIIFLAYRDEIKTPCIKVDDKYRENSDSIKKPDKRESITFILGDDKEPDNPYYSEATNYYLLNKSDRTEYVITDCRSLLEVRNYLEEHAPANNLPWGLINLVSHGNQWLGLSVRITPGSKRTTAVRILEYISNDSLAPLPNKIADQYTEIFIHGCGIGNDGELISAMALAFGGQDSVPEVKASKLFEYYSSVRKNNAILETNRYFAKSWFVTYKMGFKPEDALLCQQFEMKYPGEKLDWKYALLNQQPLYNGDLYNYSFEIPVKWLIPSSDSTFPDLTTKKEELNWIKGQKEITRDLNKIQIPAEDFNWWIRKVYVNNEDGSRSPAVWVKGYCTVLTIIKPQVEQEKNLCAYDLRPEYNKYSYSYSLKF